MTNKLEPCPFCGATANLQGKRVFYVECSHCFAKTDKFALPTFAIQAWNKRCNSNADIRLEAIKEFALMVCEGRALNDTVVEAIRKELKKILL